MTILRSRQAVFNKVWEQAKGMTQKAMDGETCSYRSPVGPCLIGGLIKDEHYKPSLEEKLASTASVMEALELSGIKLRIKEPNEFLENLQKCHDEAYEGTMFNKTMMGSLKRFADSYGLKVPQ